MENPATLTPLGHSNLAVNSRGERGSQSVDFPIMGSDTAIPRLHKAQTLCENFNFILTKELYFESLYFNISL